MMPSPSIAEAKDRLLIPELWRILDLPGTPSKSCRCPWREDHKPSFSVSDDGLLWNDFTTGQGGDAIDFLREATGLSKDAAFKKFMEMAGGMPSTPLPVVRRAATPPQARELPVLPAMRSGTPEEHKVLAALRHVHLEAVRVADGADLLRFGESKGCPAWFVVDPGGRNAQARRLDGRPWEGIDAKAQTLPGCWASWPIGAGHGDYDTICLVEGGPDLLAALHFIVLGGRAAEVAPVAMLGAGQKIHPEALPWFAGRRVRIYAHADDAGRAAAQRWRDQLIPVGATVDAVDCGGYRMQDGRTSGDLNDLTQIHPDDAGELTDLLPK